MVGGSLIHPLRDSRRFFLRSQDFVLRRCASRALKPDLRFGGVPFGTSRWEAGASILSVKDKNMCRTYGAGSCVCFPHPALTHWANVCRTSGARERADPSHCSQTTRKADSPAIDGQAHSRLVTAGSRG